MPSPDPPPESGATSSARRRWRVRGIVQGVGFRPWVCLVAGRLGLSGEVGNDASGVWIEAEGPVGALAAMGLQLSKAPPPARVLGVDEETPGIPVARTGGGFRVAESRVDGAGAPALAPDLAPCADCRRDLFDPRDRRFRYPFLACARCGPRYTVTAALPYDRARTALAEFPLCADCAREYTDPTDRRFHAEAIACPRCGPRLCALAADGTVVAEAEDALQAAARVLAYGGIVAVQAAGGFQLWTDATSAAAVKRLRLRKHREAKPLAVMVFSLAQARELADLSPGEEELLQSPEAPIVLVRPRSGSPLAPDVAPGCATIGLCLPAAPLQILLCDAFPRPVVATSGNLSDEPLCHEPADAVARLGALADLLLVHDRKILNPADDSVARVLAGQARLLRRARGHAPAAERLPLPVAHPGLAVGGQVKGAMALVRGRDLVLSPHLGDQDTVAARGRHAATTAALQNLLRLEPAWLACDPHPGYAATTTARAMALPRLEVQHHHAHLLAVLAEQSGMPGGPVLGVMWDGSGYGPDGTVWGGEFLLADGVSCRRVGHLRRFALPGGERAVREPRRSAFAWLWECLGPEAARAVASRFGLPAEPLGKLCDGAAGTPRTSSAGRLFDAVAALAGLCTHARFEGEAAMLLETAAAAHQGASEPFPFVLRAAPEATDASVRLAGPHDGWRLDFASLPDCAAWEIDTAPMAAAIWQAVLGGAPAPWIAACFHRTLVAVILAMAERLGFSTVALGGGCFQNALLFEETLAALAGPGRTVLAPARYPANDGGLAAGQAFAGVWLHRDA